MLDLTDGLRAFLMTLESLSTDFNGREIYVGLTRYETERYHFLSGPLRYRTPEERDEYLALHTKHELVRKQVLCAKGTKRVDNPACDLQRAPYWPHNN